MSQIKLYIASSLDGFIADKDGSVSWIDQFHSENKDNDYGYSDFFETIGTVVMGRKTYEQILSFPCPWPYAGRKCFVFSRNKNTKISTPDTEIVTTGITENITKIKQSTDKDIWLVGGGKMVADFCDAKVIDEFWIFLMPLLLGDGIKLAVDLENPQKLILEKMETMEKGVIKLIYNKE